MGKPIEEEQRHAGEQDRQHRHFALGKGLAEQHRRLEIHQSVGTAGEVSPLGRAVLDDEGKGDRHHSEIGSADAKRRQRQQEADQPRDDTGQRKRNPEIDTLEGQDGGGVGADRVEADVTERHLAGQPDQDVETDADHSGQRDQRQHERRVAVRGRGIERRGRGQRQDRQWRAAKTEAIQARHTLFTAARPKKPFGMAASASITTENVTICV